MLDYITKQLKSMCDLPENRNYFETIGKDWWLLILRPRNLLLCTNVASTQRAPLGAVGCTEGSLVWKVGTKGKVLSPGLF